MEHEPETFLKPKLHWSSMIMGSKKRKHEIYFGNSGTFSFDVPLSTIFSCSIQFCSLHSWLWHIFSQRDDKTVETAAYLIILAKVHRWHNIILHNKYYFKYYLQQWYQREATSVVTSAIFHLFFLCMLFFLFLFVALLACPSVTLVSSLSSSACSGRLCVCLMLLASFCVVMLLVPQLFKR